MFIDISLPWWGWGYLLFVLAMFITSFLTDKSLNMDKVIGSSLSLFSICVFVVGFFNYELVSFLGVLIIPMAMIGIYWEFTKAIRETRNAELELAGVRELGDVERAFLLNLAIGFNALIIVPGYVVGMVLSFQIIRSILGA